MKIAMIGTGYVGLVSGTCFAQMGNFVICVDQDEEKIEMLNRCEAPIYEPGLEEMIRTNARAGRLRFCTDLKRAVEASNVVFIAVGTPPGADSSADLSQVLAAAKEIGHAINSPKIIVDKSTVPVGTADRVKSIIAGILKERGVDYPFSVVSNPEFLKEGMAIEDFMSPDRIILGVDNEEAANTLKELYQPFTLRKNRVITMGVRSAEMTKYAANAMLATKISFMNELSHLCESTGADIAEVRAGIGSDSRIGYRFIYPGVGFGGSCFPKDLSALISMHREHGSSPRILQAVEETNRLQKTILVDKLISLWGENMQGKTVALWGLAFKPQTDDMREAPSLVIIDRLLQMGARLKAFDPVAMDNARKIYASEDRIRFMPDEYASIENADAMLLITEWHQFRFPDFERMKQLMREPLILDGRNQYEPKNLKELGFTYYAVGRGFFS